MNSSKQTIGILGYGSQAQTWAKNLRSNGVNVYILLRKASESNKLAEYDKFPVINLDKNSNSIYLRL